ncbi:MAG TPA: chloride channel protein [Spirochaetota bacterium]|nr:chloride channel protein [Spirochaetota bacterium]HPI90978.1 chloride channel protein [Spirochaetota bacterium]HPR47507.1 chloride channel protein [Spirochaetota bacterium]
MEYFRKLQKSLTYTFNATTERARKTEHVFMVAMAIIIGILGGFGAIAIRAMIKAISSLSFPGKGDLLHNIISNPWYVVLLVPALGGLIVGPIIYFFAREAKGHGVPEVMQSIILKGGVIRPRVALIKAVTSAITIGTGGSVGREGPIVQIGSSIGSTVGQMFRVSSARMKTFVGCGAAAGIAAAFNAPVAGALFAVEIILKDFTFLQFSPIVISSVMATVVSHHFEGNFAAFQVPTYHLTSSYELIFYFVLAVLSAFVGFVFIKVLYACEEFFDERFDIPGYLKPAVGGILVGAIALTFPEIMGIGYETINNALHGKMIWHFAILLIFVKIIATSLTLGSGGSGGIFAPSLFLGAMCGVFFGGFVHWLFPDITSTPGAYALVAMGGLVAATTHAPITAIIIVFELTNDYQIILPLMITCIISTIISTKLSRESIYTLKLVRRNILLKDGAEINIMKSLFVKDIYTKSAEVIKDTAAFDEVVNRVITGHDPYFPVVDQKKRILGIVSIHDIKEHLYDREILRNLLIARDVANENLQTVSPGDNCQTALDSMSSSNLMGLPVVDRKDQRLLGMIWRKDILDAYNREIEARDMAASFASRITMKNIDSAVHFMEGYSLTEIPTPKAFIGKTIKELNIRAVYGVDIILIRNNSEQGSKIKAIPSPDYCFSYNDSIVVAGEIGRINLLKSL